MSQRKQDYTPEKMIEELLKMDRQIVDGSDFFKQCADVIQSIDSLKEKLAGVEKEFKDLHVTAGMIQKERNELSDLRHDLIKERDAALAELTVAGKEAKEIALNYNAVDCQRHAVKILSQPLTTKLLKNEPKQ